MDQKTINTLETEIGEAIAEAIDSMGLKKLPLLPARLSMCLLQ